MKRSELLRHLRKHGCVLKRQGKAHEIWRGPAVGTETVPRHSEISEQLANKICTGLGVPRVRS